MNMRLLGARTLEEVVPAMVDASGIHSHTVSVPSDRLYEGNCACPPFLVGESHAEVLQTRGYSERPYGRALSSQNCDARLCRTCTHTG
jgi:hypothetical protein